MRNLSRVHVFVFAMGLAALGACKSATDATAGDGPGSSLAAVDAELPSIAVTSSAFAANGTVPAAYTCEGRDTSPPLSWSGLPDGTKSVVVIVDDPDAPDPAEPKMTWVHWVLYDLPPGVGALAEDADKSGLPDGARRGSNDWKRADYGGPCPPVGRHRYFHKVYALDTLLGELKSATKADVEAAMKGHVIAYGELVGTYQKAQ